MVGTRIDRIGGYNFDEAVGFRDVVPLSSFVLEFWRAIIFECFVATVGAFGSRRSDRNFH